MIYYEQVNREKEKVDYKKQGKRNKASGADFEKRTRADLESKGWIVSKWQNNIKECKCVPTKPGRYRLMQTGFPDFMAFRQKLIKINEGFEAYNIDETYEIIFVECKSNGYLKPEEKEKAEWYLKNNYCSKFLVAKKIKENNRIKIEYKEFER
jgi:hypothetical protein